MVAVSWRAGRVRRFPRGRVPDVPVLAGRVVAGLLAVVLAVRGVAGWLLVSFGVWSAWHPGGFIVGGVLLLADRVADERPKRERRPE